MKNYLLLGAACALVAGSALAQERSTTTTVENSDG